MKPKHLTLDEASSSAIIVKNAILARSGIYVYSHEEMLRRGYTPEVTKDFYREYRPASVLVAAKDKFKYAVLTKEHPASITSDNVRQVIEGVVGGNIEVVVLDNEEVALKGEIAFYTKDGVEYYGTGAKETSAQYISKAVPVFGDDYDYILESIEEVQGLALTRQGRGGASVAVLDSLISAEEKSAGKNKKGDKSMGNKNSILSFLGIGKSPQDELPSLVIDSLKGYDALSDVEKKARKDKVDLLINPLSDTPEKKILMATVQDCFSYPKEVLEKSEEVSKGLTSLYNRCVSDEAATLQATFDSIKNETKDKSDEDKKKEEDEAKAKEKETQDAEDEAKKKEEEAKKKDETKDSSQAIDVEALITKVTDSVTASVTANISAKIDEAVKKQLGLETEEDKKATTDSVLPSFSAQENDSSFLLKNMFQ